MLPPFVPPSARVARESLPLITEFVVDPVEQSFDASFSASGEAVGIAVATLPSIDEFVRDEVDSGSLFPGEPSRSGVEDAIVNETVEPAEAWAASAAPPVSTSGAEAVAPPQPAAELTGSPTQQLHAVAPEGWVAEERDAFDWGGVASLAVPPAEDQRAAEEWSSTEWDKSAGTVQEHVATVLAQLARRIRAGELEVQGSRRMSSEEALVAALAAMLAESGSR
ncbi:MAG: hypothetical protein ABI194_07190 [Gemmatimonadaceae bacterium]